MLTSLHQQSAFSLGFPEEYHSKKPLKMIHFINASRKIDRIFSGGATRRDGLKRAYHYSPVSSKTSYQRCLITIHSKGLICNK